jgi:hypothetical protein
VLRNSQQPERQRANLDDNDAADEHGEDDGVELSFGVAARVVLLQDLHSALDRAQRIPDLVRQPCRHLAQEIYMRLSGITQPVDVVVAVPEDLERYGKCPALVYRWALEEGKEENATLFNEQLVKKEIHSIEVNPLEVIEEPEEEGAITLQKENHQEWSNKSFFETIGTIKEVITHIKGKQYAEVRKLKRWEALMDELAVAYLKSELAAWGVMLGQITGGGSSWPAPAASVYAPEPDAGFEQFVDPFDPKAQPPAVAKTWPKKYWDDCHGTCWFSTWGVPRSISFTAEAVSAGVAGVEGATARSAEGTRDPSSGGPGEDGVRAAAHRIRAAGVPFVHGDHDPPSGLVCEARGELHGVECLRERASEVEDGSAAHALLGHNGAGLAVACCV